jgi:DNA-binding transcriptional LysR family regulator
MPRAGDGSGGPTCGREGTVSPTQRNRHAEFGGGPRTSVRDSWLGIELRHFAALAAIAEESSFRGAAERLGYVQSAISRQIAHLEELTGSRLIERAHGPKPVYLTAMGELLLGHAEEILSTIEAAKDDLEDRRAAPSRDVRVGVFPGVPTRILATSLPAFGRRFPGVRVSLTERISDELLSDLVRKGRIDVAFARLPPEPGPLASLELLRVPWVLLVRAGAKIATTGATPTLGRVAKLPLIGFQSPRMEPWSDPRLRARIEPQIVLRCEAPHTAQALVGAGLGAAIIPRLAVQEGDARTAVVELGDMFEPDRVGLVWRHGTSSTGVVQFRELVRQVCSTLGPAVGERRFAARPHSDFSLRLDRSAERT